MPLILAIGLVISLIVGDKIVENKLYSQTVPVQIKITPTAVPTVPPAPSIYDSPPATPTSRPIYRVTPTPTYKPTTQINTGSYQGIPCQTASGFYYASSQEDCSATQIASRKYKDDYAKYQQQAQQAQTAVLNALNNGVHVLDGAPIFPSIAPITPVVFPTLSAPTPTPCIVGMVNSFGAVGAVPCH